MKSLNTTKKYEPISTTTTTEFISTTTTTETPKRSLGSRLYWYHMNRMTDQEEYNDLYNEVLNYILQPIEPEFNETAKGGTFSIHISHVNIFSCQLFRVLLIFYSGCH